MVSASHRGTETSGPRFGAWHADAAAGEPAAVFRLKAALDFVVALLLFLLTLPLVLLAMGLVWLTSRGPAIYKQTRLGQNGRPFTIYKIRTMTHDAERHGPRWCLPGDTRVTLVGRWLRLTHIDELPQLWNVLKGDMSLIGPRPERPEFVPKLETAIPHYRKRLAVRPGVTGLAQVQLPPDTDLESVRLKLAYDLHYVHSAGFLLDLRIYWATFFRMMGVPFGCLRFLFALPRREAVLAGYQELAARHASLRTSLADAAKPVDAPVPVLN